MGSDIFLPDESVPRSASYGEYFLEFAWTPDPNGYYLSGMIGWIPYHGQDASYTEEYTYENGRLTRKFITITTGDEYVSFVNTEEYVYAYDEEGRIASEQCTVTSGENSWISTLYYIYRDVFFYEDEPESVDQEQIDKIIQYEKALDVLALLESCNGDLVYEGEKKTQQEWLAFVRQSMIDAAGYGESNRILTNFSQLENVLVGVSDGPNGGSFVKEYGYDAAGRLIFANDNYYTKYLYCTLELPVTPHYYFEYDAQNRVSRIIHKNGDALYATFTLTYNDRGQVKRMDIVMADGQERYATFTYTGDMMPRYINEEDYEDDFGELDENAFNVLNCISHGEMFMDFAWTPDFDGYTYSGMSFWFPVSEEEWLGYSEYVEYDDQDRRIKKTVWLDDEVDAVITYTYDANGKLISETHTAADGQTVTYYYIYQSILVYDFDAQ
jgi:YD repeat-containing protein